MKRMTLWEMEQPRVGRRFSLNGFPAARPQRYWQNHLPWRTRVELVEPQITSLREALGCDADDIAIREMFKHYLNAFEEGSLLLRVIELNEVYSIFPGRTIEEDQARMDRWLPPGWKYNAEQKQLSWSRWFRFASFNRNVEVAPNSVHLIVGSATTCDVVERL